MIIMTSQAFSGKHLGEEKWLAVDVEYSGTGIFDPDGLPIYRVGSNMKFDISIENTGNRKYNNFQIRWKIKYAQDYPNCANKGDTLPGDSVSEWQDATLDKKETILFYGSYPVPGMCSAYTKVYLELEAKHMNNEVLVFPDPLPPVIVIWVPLEYNA